MNNDLQNTETSSNTSPSKNCGMISGAPEGFAASAPLGTFVMLLVIDRAPCNMEIVLDASMRK